MTAAPVTRNCLFFLLNALIIFCQIACAEPAPLSPFGIGSCYINSRSVKDFERWVPQMQKLGLRSFRSGATGWSQVEPDEGRFKWQALDEQLEYLSRHEFVFGGLLNGGVEWNKLDPGGHLPVNNLEAWGRYVAAVVGHTRGKIRHWEVWNEPPNGTGRDQTPADYARLVVKTFTEAKKANPDCLIGLAAKSAHLNYLAQAIKAGAAGHFDYITLHPYEIFDAIVENRGTEAIYMNIVPAVRKMLGDADPGRLHVPIIFTELGCDVKKGAERQAQAIVKGYVMAIAQGVESLQWFEGMDGDSGPLGLLDGQGQPRPCYYSLGRLIEAMGPAPEYLGWNLLENRHYAFYFKNQAQTVAIAWAYRGQSAELKFPRPQPVVNSRTGDRQTVRQIQLTADPIFLIDPPAAWLDIAAANKGKPLSWQGEYQKAQSVSITLTEPGQERGLHSLSGDALAQAVVAYGGSARAGNLPGGNLFVVDPAFLSYHSRPIEITAVVRRMEGNANAGFKLVYESSSGFKTAGSWFTIPDNKQWHTVSWKIDDAQFVNYWGYNFAFESDGNTYNKFYIQSVSVRKR